MKKLSSDNQADVITAFNLTSRHLHDLLNIDNPYFEGMVNQIYPRLCFIQNDKRDDFDFDTVNFPFLDGDVPRRPSYGVYISQLMKILS